MCDKYPCPFQLITKEKMMEYEKILKMIESVSPDDIDTLAEISARSHAFIHKTKVAKQDGKEYWLVENEMGTGTVPKPYGRSLDACKAIQPEGWILSVEGWEKGSWLTSLNKNKFFTTEFGLPTEELARLHAIIQAIAYERKDDGTPSNSA